jgi:hypothetical protein
MASRLPLNIPVTITQRATRKVEITLCEPTFSITSGSAWAVPQFYAPANIFAFQFGGSEPNPVEKTWSPGEPLHYISGMKSWAPQGGVPQDQAVLSPRATQSLSWSNAGGVITVTIPLGTSYPNPPPLRGQFDADYTPVRYGWYLKLNDIFVVQNSLITLSIQSSSSGSGGGGNDVGVCGFKVL